MLIRRIAADLEKAPGLVAERGSVLGTPMHLLASTTSTNDEAKHAAKDGAPSGSTWVAEQQTAGRGRQGRAWVSPRGENLLFSVLVRVTCPPSRLPPIALAAGLAVRDALALAAPEASPRIKWPNDVLHRRQEDRRRAGGGGHRGLACPGGGHRRRHQRAHARLPRGHRRSRDVPRARVARSARSRSRSRGRARVPRPGSPRRLGPRPRPAAGSARSGRRPAGTAAFAATPATKEPRAASTTTGACSCAATTACSPAGARARCISCDAPGSRSSPPQLQRVPPVTPEVPRRPQRSPRAA
jgi:hypothetical protein